MRQTPTKIKAELEGSIKIDSYDHNGSVLSIKIVTGSNEYLLGDNRCSLYLTRLIGKRVFLRGDLISEPGLTYFDVEEFKDLSTLSTTSLQL